MFDKKEIKRIQQDVYKIDALMMKSGLLSKSQILPATKSAVKPNGEIIFPCPAIPIYLKNDSAGTLGAPVVETTYHMVCPVLSDNEEILGYRRILKNLTAAIPD